MDKELLPVLFPAFLPEVVLVVGCVCPNPNRELSSRQRQDGDPALAPGISEDRLHLGKVEPWDTRDVGASPPKSVSQSKGARP